MIRQLRRHPFPVIAHFDFSLVLAYALPVEVLQPLLPPGLVVDAFGGYGFVAAAMVQTRDLRPAGFPAWMGQDFFLTGYRIFVQYHTHAGKRLRGLYILRSVTDSKRMEILGNAMTHYHYTTADIRASRTGNELSVVCKSADGRTDATVRVSTALPEDSLPLPSGSPFASWKEARRFAGPLPFTFDYETGTQRMLIVQGVREHWEPTPVQVQEAEVAFVHGSLFGGAPPVLANAFIVEDIPYRWEKGRVD